LSSALDANYTAETFVRKRPKIYRQVANLISEGWSQRKIARLTGVCPRLTKAIWKRESEEISARKNKLVSLFANVAQLSAERVEQKVGQASVRDAIIGSGVAVDKMLALLGQTPNVQVAIVNMPSELERAERRQMHDKLDDIAKRLALPENP
jgi:sugar-specific transcriptional regulator TrmB